MPTALGLHYIASGQDDYLRPPVVFIHGAGGNHLYWPPQVRRLHNQRLFAVDLSGHGHSGGIGHQRVQDYAEEVLGVMTELRLNRAVLVGHSMGGAIALDAALRRPERVLGLGLISTGARLRVHPDIMRAAAQPDTFPSAIRMLGERSFGPSAQPRLKELALVRLTEMRPSVLYGDLMACEGFDCMEEVFKIAVPTTIICGSNDQMTPPRYSGYLHDKIAGSALREISGAGHMVMLEEPNAVAGTLATFFDSLDYQPGR